MQAKIVEELRECAEPWQFHSDPQRGTARRLMLEAADIIARLPVTADGVPFFEGDEVWHPMYGRGIVRNGTLPGCGGVQGLVAEYPDDEDEYDAKKDWVAAAKACYSTRAAAEAAAKVGGE